MPEVHQHFKLTTQEFNDNISLFKEMEIKKEQVVGENYQYLSKYLKKQHKKLILVNHPDKGGNKSRFNQIYKAYQELKKYIEPLESGNPYVKVSIDVESDGHLTEREFHYRNKLFEKLNIPKEEVVQKTFEEIIIILSSRDSEFLKVLNKCDALKDERFSILKNTELNYFQKIIKIKKLEAKLRQYSAQPSMQLFDYVTLLKNKSNLILEDKKELTLKFIEHKHTLLSISIFSIVPLDILTVITIACYLSCWIIAFEILTGIIAKKLMSSYETKYKNSEISTDEFVSKIQYLLLGSKLLIKYPLVAFSVNLLATNFIANGLTIGGIILGPLLALAIIIEVLAPIFSKGCEIYTEKHIRDLLEENSRDMVQKETNLLKWYDPRLLLMPIIMPIVRKCFVELANELAERNFDEVNTNMSNIKPEQLQAIEMTAKIV